MRSRYLSEGEIVALRKTIKGSAWLPYRVSFETGLRIGDVLKIRLSDLRDDGIFFVSQKTSKTGFAHVHAGTISALRQNAGGGEWCFPSPRKRGRHLTRQAAWHRLKAACKLAGVEADGVSPHSFRKVFSVELYKRSNLHEVQKALQHSNIHTTEIYTLSDWTTGENASKPILRGDLCILAQKVADIVIERLDKSKHK